MAIDSTDGDGLDRVPCWRCGYRRLTYESCPHSGGSCKPETRREQLEADLVEATVRGERLAAEVIEAYVEQSPEGYDGS